MKQLLSLALALIVPVALMAAENTADKTPEFVEVKAGQPVENQIPKIEKTVTVEEAGTVEEEKEYVFGWHDLAYGPMELLGGVTAPLSMGFIGAYACITAPKSDLATYLLVPYAVPSSLAVNTVYGAVVAPVLIVEGLCDTLTLGAWYPEHQAFNQRLEEGYDKRYREIRSARRGEYPPEAVPVDSDQEGK